MEFWRIYYSDGSFIDGRTQEDWVRAPYLGVQVIVLYKKPGLHERRWTGIEDRYLWMGDDFYDPFGWGEKEGELISDEEYLNLWMEAAYGDYTS